METYNLHSHSPPATTTNTNSAAPSVERPRAGGIGRRPLHYTGSDGWLSRMSSRTLYGAGIGAGLGLVMGTCKGSNMLKLAGIMATNCALVTLCFSGSQELVREIRASDPDDLVNCVLGGVTSGGLVGRIQGGPARALPCALVFASVGTGLQFGTNKLREYRIRQFLQQSIPEMVSKPAIESEIERGSWKFPEWFPVQVLDEEAAAKRKAEKELEFKERVDRLQRVENP